MTHVCCPGCRLRFGPAVAAYLEACPRCGEPPESGVTAERALGFGLFVPADDLHELPTALAAALVSHGEGATSWPIGTG
jgi:hypothetical protein